MCESGQKQENPKSIVQQAYEDVMREQDEKCFEEIRSMMADREKFKIEVYQQDWMPGFAAFLDDGSIRKGTAHVALNIGALISAVATHDIEKKDLPYVVAESLMHEIVHALEAWAGVEFDEDKVEDLIAQYREKYKDEKPEEIDNRVLEIEDLLECPCGGGKPVYTTFAEVEGDIPYGVVHFTNNKLKCPKCHTEMCDRNKQNCFRMWNEFVTGTVFDETADHLEGQA